MSTQTKLSTIAGALLSKGKTTVIVSGALAAGALLLGWLTALAGVADGFMIAAAVVAGAPVVRTAIDSLRARHVSIELLVTIAAVGAVVIGEYWEAAAVTFLFALGGWLEARTMSRTRKVIGELLDLAPVQAIVLRDGRQQEIDAMEVEPGEQVIVKPGAKVPVDGTVVAGSSSVDESAITGESYPNRKGDGAEVYAGTFNTRGMLTVEANGVGEDTTLARIIRRVEEAQEAKAPTQRFMERFAKWYTPLIIVLSAGSFAVTGSVELALTVLVIGCPGALVISTPVSVVAGIGGSARHGILMKGGAHLEESGRISIVALDKTGTLTVGKPTVTQVIPAGQDLATTAAGAEEPAAGHAVRAAAAGAEDPGMATATLSEPRADQTEPSSEAGREILYWAAVAEQSSDHPLASAIRQAAESLGELPSPETAEAVAGRGVVVTYRGSEVLVGSPRLMEEHGIPLGDGAGRLDEYQQAGTVVLVAMDGEFLGTLVVSDPVRADAREAIARLRSGGVKRIVMLTGDNSATAEAVAREVGITEVRAELMPEQKLEHIEKLRAEGEVVAMVGDGINDAPALAAANVGMAMGAGGTDVAIETADIALMRDDLLLLAEAVRRAKKTVTNIRQNVVIAVVTVAALLTGVLLGEVHMAGGMLVHEASVMVVILNGMRLLRG